MKAQYLFHTWPYAALAILVVGFATRAFLVRLRPASTPSKGSRAGAIFMRAAWIVLLGGHLLAFLLPTALLSWNTVAWRLYLIEGVGFLAGLAVLAAWAVSAWRRFVRTASAASEIVDSVFLATLFASVVSGLLMAARYRWGSSWGAATMAPYLGSLAEGAPQTDLVEQMPFWIQLHVFAAFTTVAVLPFTSAAPVAILAVQRSFAFVGRPIARPITAWIRSREAARERASGAAGDSQASGVRAATAGLAETVPVARESASKN